MSLFLQRDVSGAPVVNDSNQVIGVVSTFDFLPKEAFEGALLPMEGPLQNVVHYVEAARKICAQRVADVMTTSLTSSFKSSSSRTEPDHVILTIDSTATMRQAATLMTEYRIQLLPVIDPFTSKLVGVLSSQDIMKDLLHLYKNLPPASSPAP
jgi:CBS domain-containing protein